MTLCCPLHLPDLDSRTNRDSPWWNHSSGRPEEAQERGDEPQQQYPPRTHTPTHARSSKQAVQPHLRNSGDSVPTGYREDLWSGASEGRVPVPLLLLEDTST